MSKPSSNKPKEGKKVEIEEGKLERTERNYNKMEGLCLNITLTTLSINGLNP